MDTIICNHCDMVSTRPILRPGQVAKCPRCHRAFFKTNTLKANKMFALAITALILIIPAFTFPLMSIHLLGITEGANLLQGALMMIEGAPVVTFVILFCAVLVPTLLTLCIAYSSASIMLGKRPPLLGYVLKLTSSLIHWSMLDVYLISLLVSAVKITSDADVYFSSGLCFFVVLLIVNITLISEYSSTKYWKYLRNE